MIEPTAFGKYLKEKRKAASLKQDELAAAINKTGQYISNIEKGKNSAPPKISDIEALICRLNLNNSEAREFRRLAAADRNQLSGVQMSYLLSHKSLLTLIDYGIEHGVEESRWEELLLRFSNNSVL